MLADILEGHYNEAFGKNEELGKERMAICKDCPLFSIDRLGKMCSSKIYYNEETGTSSPNPGAGFKRGWSCSIDAKTKRETSKCPRNK